MRTKSLVTLLLLLQLSKDCRCAFLKDTTTGRSGTTRRSQSQKLTTLNGSFWPRPPPVFSSLFPPYSGTKIIKNEAKAQDQQKLREQDFLLVPVKPKILNHERDFFRQSTRIQAWDEYVLVCILCTSISYNALQTFQLNPDHEGVFLYEVVIRSTIQIVSSLSCLSGIYSTMVFALSILYGRTALGVERDPQYDSFLGNTLDVRIKAFRAFSISLGLLAVLVVLVLLEDLPTPMLPPVGLIGVLILSMGFKDWKTLVDEASPIYYTDDDDDDDDDND